MRLILNLKLAYILYYSKCIIIVQVSLSDDFTEDKLASYSHAASPHAHRQGLWWDAWLKLGFAPNHYRSMVISTSILAHSGNPTWLVLNGWQGSDWEYIMDSVENT